MCKRMRPNVWVYRIENSDLWGIFCAYRDPEDPTRMLEEVIESNGAMVAWSGRPYPENGMLYFLSSCNLLTIIKHGHD